MSNGNVKVCSFFSGLGFLDLGFEEAGFEVVFVNEVHKPFLDAYKFARQKNKNNNILYANKSIEDFLLNTKTQDIKYLKDITKQNLSLFIGGPPCPDFSVGGKNKGEEGENGKLSQTYIDLICKYKPTAFLFENVKGLWRTKRHREFFENLKKQLSKNGYELTERLTNSIEYGVAQDRDRILLIGVQKKHLENIGILSLQEFKWTKYMKYPNGKNFLKKKNEGINLDEKNYPKDLTIDFWFNKNKVLNHPNSTHCFIPRAALSKFQTIKEGDDSKKSFKRLHRFRYSPTAAYGNNEVHIHPTEPRRINVAEALAIQSLPKNFSLPDNISLTNMFKGIGNGVPFLLALGIAKSIKNQLFIELDEK